MGNIIVDETMLLAFDDYDRKSKVLQKYLFEGNPERWTREEVEEMVDDNLMFHVPIYDMLDRRYAAFSSFLEALHMKDRDPKGNGKFFSSAPGMSELDDYSKLALFYLFRLCGSGINYKPKIDSPIGTHGFGNFWVVNSVLEGKATLDEWLEDLEKLTTPFTDSKGYLLPMISYKGMRSGHMKRFILEETRGIIDEMMRILVVDMESSIIGFVDSMNDYLCRRGFKRQFFTLSATAADIAEYTDLIDQNSMIYAGTNAKKCIGLLFKKRVSMSALEFESSCIQFLSDRYGAPPYSVEDSRLCDIHRYLNDFQSADHIAKNGGKTYKNNSILRTLYDEREYQELISKIN